MALLKSEEQAQRRTEQVSGSGPSVHGDLQPCFKIQAKQGSLKRSSDKNHLPSFVSQARFLPNISLGPQEERCVWHHREGFEAFSAIEWPL